MNILLSSLCLTICLTLTDSQVFPQDIDCQFSPWSEYVPHPHIKGLLIRTRSIAVPASGFGRNCTGELEETIQAADFATPTLSKFLTQFLSGDRRTVSLGGSLLGRGQVPQKYTLSRDIAFLIDTTLFDAALPLYKTLLTNLVGSVCGTIGNAPTDNLFSLITYDSTKTTLLHSFNDFQFKAELQRKITSITASQGNGKPSLLLNAMRLAHEQVSNPDSGTRSYSISHKDVLAFVTYRTVCSPQIVRMSERLRVQNRLYLVVLGEAGDGSFPPNPWCLQQLVSRRFDSHFLWVKSYDDLQAFAAWTADISSHLNPCDPGSQVPGSRPQLPGEVNPPTPTHVPVEV